MEASDLDTSHDAEPAAVEPPARIERQAPDPVFLGDDEPVNIPVRQPVPEPEPEPQPEPEPVSVQEPEPVPVAQPEPEVQPEPQEAEEPEHVQQEQEQLPPQVTFVCVCFSGMGSLGEKKVLQTSCKRDISPVAHCMIGRK